MEVSKTKALIQQQVASRLDFYTSKKVNDSSSSALPFNVLMKEQMLSKVWDPAMGEQLEAADHNVWSYLAQAGVDHVQRYGHIEESLIQRIKQTQSFGNVGMNHLASSFAATVNNASQKYGVDASLIHAVIQTESSYRPDAVSSAGAKGLMQLMDGTAKGLGVTDSFDPTQNIEGGTRYLSMLLKKYNGQEQVALAAYNAGPGRVDRTGITTNEELQQKLHLLPQETQRYIGKVLSAKA